jgi:hypothetical protein
LATRWATSSFCWRPERVWTAERGVSALHARGRFGREYFIIDATTNRYVLDANGNLIYSATPLRTDMLQTYTVATLPAGSTVLTSDGEGNPLTMNVGGYIYNVIYTVQVTEGVSVTITTYDYTASGINISNVSSPPW